MWEHATSELRRLAALGKPPESWAEFFFGFLAVVTLLGLILTLLERWFPEQPSQPSVLKRPEARTDFAYWWIQHFMEKVAGLGILIVAFTILLLKVPRFETILAVQPVPLQALEAFLVGDLMGYWIHRAFHEIPWLWRFHAVHHSSTNLDWLAGGRVHPIETLCNKVTPFAVIFCLGFSPAIGIVFGPIVALHAIFLHANVKWDFGPVRWILSSPAYHRWHHAAEPEAVDKNFAGLFPFYDRIFGTAYFPKGRAPLTYGLIGETFPKRLRDQLRYPWTRPVWGTLTSAQPIAANPASDSHPPSASNQA